MPYGVATRTSTPPVGQVSLAIVCTSAGMVTFITWRLKNWAHFVKSLLPAITCVS